MLHVKFENHGCSDFRELVTWMDLNARVDVNFQMVPVTWLQYSFFNFDDSEHQCPTDALYMISAKYTKTFSRKSWFYWTPDTYIGPS